MSEQTNEQPTVEAAPEEKYSNALEGEIASKVDEMVQQNSAPGSVNNPEDVYAGVVYIYGARFKAGLRHLSNRQKDRLINALMQYPLNVGDYKATSQLEKDMLLIGDAVLQAKYAMIIQHLMSQEESRINEQTEQQPQQRQEEIK